MIMETAFETFLNSCDERTWEQTLAELSNSIHEVDREATNIWFAFFPLSLHRALAGADDPEELAKRLLLQGKYGLKDQIDSSHRFLYGHRFWPETKKAIIAHADSAGDFDGVAATAKLAEQIHRVAEQIAAEANVDASLTLGITAVAFMTIAQVGLESFKASPGTIEKTNKSKKSPAQILRERSRDEGQGLFGFLKSVDKQWTVVFDESDSTAKFKTIHMEEIASGAARMAGAKDWRAIDSRCIEGPIPVECRSASCGTCWVGVLGGREKLSPVTVRESRQMKEFGYIDTDEERPAVRLACMAQATGAVSIVIPPWNGVFGKFLKRQREADASDKHSL